MNNFLKKYWLFIFLALIVSILASWYFIEKFNNPKENNNIIGLLPIPEEKFDSYLLKINPNFEYLIKNFPELEKEADVYGVQQYPFQEQEIFNIAKNFNFNNEPQIVKNDNEFIYIWGDQEKSLSIDPIAGNFDYILKSETSLLEAVPFFNTEEYIKGFLSEKNLYPKDKNINLRIKNLSYLKPIANEYEITNNPSEASIINLEMKYMIKDYDLLGINISALINNEEIIKLHYQTSFKEIKSLGLYPLKEKQEIINILKLNKLINYFEITDDYFVPIESEKIKEINFNEINLIYLKTRNNQSYLQPFFFIKGEGILSDGRGAEVGLYISAIKDKYLLKN